MKARCVVLCLLMVAVAIPSCHVVATATTVGVALTADMQQISASLSLRSERLAVELRLAQSVTERAIPDVSLSARSQGAGLRLSACGRNLLDSPELAVGLDYSSHRSLLSSRVELELSPGNRYFIQRATKSSSVLCVHVRSNSR